METIKDFEDLLIVFEKYKVKYIILGGLAFIFHAKPRYTKDMDIWVESSGQNVKKVNKALIEFGSPYTLHIPPRNEILQLGLPPNRIDIILNIPKVKFNTAWKKKIRSKYGKVKANWIDIDTLIKIKKGIDHPRHQDDVKILMQVKYMKEKRIRRKK